jgi:hypothetical protein
MSCCPAWDKILSDNRLALALKGYDYSYKVEVGVRGRFGIRVGVSVIIFIL